MRETETEINKSLIIPVYKTEETISALISALEKIAEKEGPSFEAVFVVDGSPDKSYELLAKALPLVNFQSRLIALSRNFGSFTAVRAGLSSARGKITAVMAADLQEPPALIHGFFEALGKDEADIVFGRRTAREDGFTQKLTSGLYWKLYRRLVLPDLPEGGVDVFAFNSKVKEALLRMEEPNASLAAQLFSAGYRRLFIPYERAKRTAGKSAWTFSKRMRYMLDSIFSHSDFPALFLLWAGTAGIAACVLLAAGAAAGKFLGVIEITGGFFFGLGCFFLGFVLVMGQGVLGCYLWRILENTKRRPLYFIDSVKQYPGRKIER